MDTAAQRSAIEISSATSTSSSTTSTRRGTHRAGQLHGGHRAVGRCAFPVHFLWRAGPHRATPARQQWPTSCPRSGDHQPPELPVTQRREDIAAAIRDHQVVVIAGETGSGKPPRCRRSASSSGAGAAGGRAAGGGLIRHTQPRRAARERIAAEVGSRSVTPSAYQVRFTDRSCKE